MQICWPLVAGLILGVLAPGLHQALADQEPWVMRVVFPFVLLAGRHELGLSDELTRTLPQLVLYLQFPIEGLIATFSMRRRISAGGALAQVAFLHGVGAFVLWLLSQSVQPPQ